MRFLRKLGLECRAPIGSRARRGAQIRGFGAVGVLFAAAIVTTSVGAQQSASPVTVQAQSVAQQMAMDAAVRQYWTAERMQSAIPMSRFTAGRAISFSRPVPTPLVGTPGYARGASPTEARSGSRQSSQVEQVPRSTVRTVPISPQPQDFSVPGGSPLNGPYGPFQRWSHEGSLDRPLYSPTETVGKLFFSIGASNFVCSATAINRSTIVTAGHCVAAGDNATFYSNFLFCPAYNVRALRQVGCWTWASATTSGPWFASGNPNYDYACIVTPNTGTLQVDKLGNVVGWAGRAWNWGNDKVEVSMGYPQGAPFFGDRLIVNSAPVWYSFAFGFGTGGVGASKFMGNDMTGGSSGGPWILGYTTSFGAEIPTVDSDAGTDPGSFNVNGVNSHKRCSVNCNTPPTATTGVFWNEMSSPRFTSGVDASGSEEVFAACFAHPNNAP